MRIWRSATSCSSSSRKLFKGLLTLKGLSPHRLNRTVEVRKQDTRRFGILAFFIHDSAFDRSVGGVERRFLELSRYLSEKGVAIYAIEVAPSLGKSWVGSHYESVEAPARSPAISFSPIYFATLIRKGLKLARSGKIDAIYVTRHDVHENIVPSYVVSRLSGRPLLMVFHHLNPNDYLKLGRLVQLRKQSGWSNTSALLYSVLDVIEREIFRRCDLAIAVSDSTAKDLKEVFSIRHVKTIGNGVTIPAVLGSKAVSKEYDAAYCGRLRPRKGVDLLIDAWKSLVQRPQYSNAKLVVIGGADSEKELKRYRKIVDESGMNHLIKLTGSVSEEEKFQLLSKSKVFILPSEAEGFGIAVLEAMSLGLPCVLSDIPAFRENFGEAALLVESKNKVELVSAIEKLLSDNALQARLSEAGMTVARRFSWDSIAQRELHAIQQTLS